MSRLMLDTSGYSALVRGHAEIKTALESAEEITVSPIVLGELYAGFRKGTRRVENENKLSRFLSLQDVGISAIDEDTAAAYAEIVNYLGETGRPIPTNDIWIAAGAMQHGLRLLTTDAHFKCVPQVIIEWYPV